MSDLFGNHIAGFPTRRLNCLIEQSNYMGKLDEHVLQKCQINDAQLSKECSVVYRNNDDKYACIINFRYV